MQMCELSEHMQTSQETSDGSRDMLSEEMQTIPWADGTTNEAVLGDTAENSKLDSLSIIYGYRDGLYTTEDDDVALLNNETFTINVANRQPGTAWVVEFYNSWCGHCMTFAPTWKRVALDYANWRDILVIAAIDCSQLNNMQTCRENRLSHYPELKVYPAVNAKGGTVSGIETSTLETIKLQILEHMVKYAADTWPNLTPLKKLDDIWVEKKANQEYQLVIFEEDTSLLGTQVILDLRDVDNVVVRRMLKSNVAGLDIKMFPSLYRVTDDFTYVMTAMGSKNLAEDRLAFVRVAKTVARSAPNQTQSLGGKVGQDEGSNSDSSLTLKRYNASTVSMQDLESALHYSLRHEVAMGNVISDMQFRSLHSFVGVLVKYFPGRQPVQGFLNRVSQMLASIQSQNISGKDWTQKINNLQDQANFLPEVVRWEACQGSSPRYRGYPCSLWMLFHTLTVGGYIHNADKNDSSANEVLLAVRDYMKHFFGCQECSRNFVWLARSIKHKVHNHKAAVLWLWNAHNSANKRLHGEPSEDPQFPKIEFPSLDMCPQCRVQISSTKLSWSMEKLMEFLVKFYSPSNITSSKNIQQNFTVLNVITNPGLVIAQGMELNRKKVSAGNDNDLLYLSLEQSEMEHFRQRFSNFSGWTHVDVDLCVMFYVTSTVILIVLGYCLIARRSRGGKKHH